MKYKLIVLDVDGTITGHISSWRYIHERLGLWDRRAFHYQEAFFAGKISYRKFCELDAAHWKGMANERLVGIFREVPYSKNAVACLKDLKSMGFALAAVSTGLQYMCDRILRELDFDYAISNRLNTYRGRLTGGVTIRMAHGAKHKVLSGIYRKFGVKPHEVISIGDSEGDIPLARNSGYSIAFNSSSEELSRVVDYNCRTKDFMDVYCKIIEISRYKKP